MWVKFACGYQLKCNRFYFLFSFIFGKHQTCHPVALLWTKSTNILQFLDSRFLSTTIGVEFLKLLIIWCFYLYNACIEHKVLPWLMIKVILLQEDKFNRACAHPQCGLWHQEKAFTCKIAVFMSPWHIWIN